MKSISGYAPLMLFAYAVAGGPARQARVPLSGAATSL